MLLSLLLDESDEDVTVALYQVGPYVLTVKQRVAASREEVPDEHAQQAAATQRHVGVATEFPTVGYKLWTASLLLAEYLLKLPGSWRGRRVVELGAGVGVLGMALAKAGALVTLTDLPNIVPLTADNVAANFQPASPQAPCKSLGRNTAAEQAAPAAQQLPMPLVVPHVWGCGMDALVRDGPPDAVVGSDLFYETRHYGALLNSLTRLCAGGSTQVYISYRRRIYDEDSFQSMAHRSGFECVAVPERELPLEYQTGGYCVLRLRLAEPVDQDRAAAAISVAPPAACT